ncbi:MAG: hypothetical protein O7C63_05995 [Alphaproteobacteria bacterium]|nr:hypothetical protein [Alphaproteobacteria bacterium]
MRKDIDVFDIAYGEKKVEVVIADENEYGDRGDNDERCADRFRAHVELAGADPTGEAIPRFRVHTPILQYALPDGRILQSGSASEKESDAANRRNPILPCGEPRLCRRPLRRQSFA